MTAAPHSIQPGTEPAIIPPNPGELQPCPFCGSEGGLEHDSTGVLASWYVYCRDMGEGCPIGMTNTIGYARRVEAVTAWNKRCSTGSAGLTDQEKADRAATLAQARAMDKPRYPEGDPRNDTL